MATAEDYREFALAEARGESPCYLQWAQGVAADRELTGLLDGLPEPKRQPSLLFAAARYAGIAPGRFAGFRTGLLTSWPEVREIMLARRTQTNEAARCAALLPLPAALPQPLVAGDLNDKIGDVAGPAPDDATLVIFHASVPGYLDAAGRSTFAATVHGLPGYWISNPDRRDHVEIRWRWHGDQLKMNRA